ncbi:hypothetical protein EBT23_04430 [bacterium]|nr:hypothetical protein [Verrucomicrobiota bacterium]NBS54794.1 hypothetical protein [bacterium]
MISRAYHHHPGVHASRLAEDLQREIWGFAQAVIDAEGNQCATNRMTYWKSRLAIAIEHAKSRGMAPEELAHQSELSLNRAQGSRHPTSQSLFQIETYLRQQGVPARLQAGLNTPVYFSTRRS